MRTVKIYRLEAEFIDFSGLHQLYQSNSIK